MTERMYWMPRLPNEQKYVQADRRNKQARADDHKEPNINFLICDAQRICHLIKELDAPVEGDVDPNNPGARHSHLPRCLETMAC